MSQPPRYRYDGPQALRGPIDRALRRVVDPELALNIVDIGLVLDVAVAGDVLCVTMTMTSAACPVTDLVLEDTQHELARVLPAGMHADLRLAWEPPWSPERMSDSARAFMGW